MANSNNFSGTEFLNKASGFDHPTQLPRDVDQQREWQKANRAWWEATPMRYDWRDPISHPPGSVEYFREVDARFFASARKYMPWRDLPFEATIPYAELKDKDVLEIGTGQGTHAQLIAPRAKSFTGIDLTEAASRMAASRLGVSGISSRVMQMDAEHMEFPDGSFDFIWSWGVIHHSSNTRRILEEMYRVLRPGGRAVIMVYHRSWWTYHCGALVRRLARRLPEGNADTHKVMQAATDGAIARYYTEKDWRLTVSDLFEATKIRIYGLKTEILPLPHGRVKSVLEWVIPDAAARMLTNHLRLGGFLVAEMRRL